MKAASGETAKGQHSESCTGVLMAGGESRRMGRDKAELELGGESLWRSQCRKLEDVGVEEVVISGRRGTRFGAVRVLEDAWPQQGPLGGLATVLGELRTKWVVVLAVDLPLVSADFLRDLLEGARADGCGRVPADGERLHPLCAVYPRAAGAVARARVERGELAMQLFVRELEAAGLVRLHALTESERALMRNLNTPADLEGLR